MKYVYAFWSEGRLTSAYATTRIAAMMRPVHAFDPTAYCFNVQLDAKDTWIDDGLRFRPRPDADIVEADVILPEIPDTARIAWALLLARDCYSWPDFLAWSDAWLEGKDRRAARALALLGRHKTLSDDRAYIAHWALMAAAFPHEPTLPAQVAALVAANILDNTAQDFQGLAELAMTMA